MAVISLLTDFGIDDPYVGLMKGVILSIAPDARMVDLTHQVAPGAIEHAAGILASSFHFFPQGSVHLAVVDPGVGTARHIVALHFAGHFFVAPDNGLLSAVVAGNGNGRAVVLNKASLFRQPVSATFHGRDIMAPAAAYLAGGMPLAQLGTPIETSHLVRLTLPQPVFQPRTGELKGQVTHVDRFGNLITNIRSADLVDLAADHGLSQLSVGVGSSRIAGIVASYGHAAPGQLLAVIGSGQMLEIAVNQSSAAKRLGCGKGAMVVVSPGGASR